MEETVVTESRSDIEAGQRCEWMDRDCPICHSKMLAYSYGRSRMDGIYSDYQLLCSNPQCENYYRAADIADQDHDFDSVEWMKLAS